MYRAPLRAALAACLLGISASPALGSSWGKSDPRTLAMGGTGVASATSGQAALLNPALLSAPLARDRFSLSIPVGARLIDPDDLIDAVDDFADAKPIDALDDALAALRRDPASDAAASAAVNAADQLRHHLGTLDNKRLQAELGAAVVLGAPRERLGFSVFVDAYAAGSARAHVTEADLSLLEEVADSVQSGDPVQSPSARLTSSVEARFAAVIETGVAISTRLEALDGVSLGITPKHVQVRTYDYEFAGSELDRAEIDLDGGERKDSGFNLDLGAAKDWDNGWLAGFSVRNLVKRTYTTVRGEAVRLEPQARLGVARRGDLLTIAADLDLSKHRRIGFDMAKTQYAMVGAELALLRTLRLRAGYRHNLGDGAAGEKKGLLSAGFGVRLLALNLDAGVAGNSNDISGALRLGLTF